VLEDLPKVASNKFVTLHDLGPWMFLSFPVHDNQERTIIQSSDGSRKDKLKKGEESFSVDEYSLFKQDNKFLG